MKYFCGILIALVCSLSFAQSTQNTKIGIKPGGKELFVKTGGMIKVRDTNLHQIPIIIVGIEGTAVGRGVAPHAGTIDSISCMSDAAIADTPTTLTAAINGTNITNGVVTISSAGSNSYTAYTASPSAAKTVAAGDAVKITSNGGTNTTSNAHCLLYITP